MKSAKYQITVKVLLRKHKENNNNKCFLWYHIRHLNSLKTHPEGIAKVDKNMVNNLGYEGIEFPVSKNDFSKIEKKNNICVSVFCYENNLVYLVYVSDQKFKNCIDLLMITNENKSHYVYIKDFNRFMCNKTKCKNKKHFCKFCLQCFIIERVLAEHKETCLKINGKQTVKLRSGSIKFKNHFKQLAVPFEIYADFECNVKRVKGSDGNNNTSHTEKYQAHIPCSFAYEVICVDDKFSKPVVLYRGKNAVYRFIETILGEYDYCKKVIKKHFNKNLVMSEKDEQIFQSSNKCWIYDKLFDVGDDKVRDQCHITGKYRGSAHWSCSINLRLTKKVPVIFHNLGRYDSHLNMRKIVKFDVKVNGIPNGLEK